MSSATTYNKLPSFLTHPIGASLVFLILLTAVGAAACFYPVQVSMLTHVLLPILAMLMIGMRTRLGYIKLSTLVLGRVVIIAAALGYGVTYVTWIGVLLLQLNIVEIIIFEIIKRRFWNVLSGLGLIGATWWLVFGWTGTYLTMQPENWLAWILAYTLWDYVFIARSLEFGQYLWGHVVILISPLFFCLLVGDSVYWLMVRETTLSTGIVSLIFLDHYLKKHPTALPWLKTIPERVEHWFDLCGVQVGCFIINGLLIGYQVWLVYL